MRTAIIRTLLALILVAGLGIGRANALFQQYQFQWGAYTNGQFTLLPGATVTVYVYNTTTKATIYNYSTGLPIANPMIADSYGNVAFQADPSLSYQLVWSSGTYTSPPTPYAGTTPGLTSANLPCTVAAANGTPCVAAYSLARSLLSTYFGPLYQVQRASDNAFMQIGTVNIGGLANIAAQTTFCAGTTCKIVDIYNQISPGDGSTTLTAPNATVIAATVGQMGQATINGVNYSYLINPGGGNGQAVGYRSPLNTAGVNIPTGSSPITVYAVFGTAQYSVTQGNACCFGFGNGETSQTDTGASHLFAVDLTGVPGTGSGWYNGAGAVPWLASDVENCASAANYCGTNPNNNSNNPGITGGTQFITGILKCDCTTNFSFYQGSMGAPLTTIFSGALPAGGWAPMHMEGSVVFGLGGDNSNNGRGSLLEGAIITGQTSGATDAAMHANVSAVFGGAAYTVGNPFANAYGADTGVIKGFLQKFYKTGLLCSLTVNYSAAGSTAQAGIYLDSSGTPTSLLGSTASFTTTGGPQTVPLTQCVLVTAGYSAWLVAETSGSAQIGFASSQDNLGIGSVSSSLPLPSSWPGTAAAAQTFQITVSGQVQP